MRRLPSGSLISQENMDLGRQHFLRQFLKKQGFTNECKTLINAWLRELDLYGNKLLIQQNKKIEDLEVDDYQKEMELTGLQEQAKDRDAQADKYRHYVGLHEAQTENIEKTMPEWRNRGRKTSTPRVSQTSNKKSTRT